MEWYYKKPHGSYKPLPPFMQGCDIAGTKNMEVLYPHDLSRILVPRELDGSMGKTVFEVIHREPEQTLYWHLAGEYLGHTRNVHRLAMQPTPGAHTLLLVDESGEELVVPFVVLPSAHQ
jgi:penicillin-binding protein 1C